MARSKSYTATEKREACVLWVTTGNNREVARITGIPEATLRGWQEQPIWEETVVLVRAQIDAQTIARFQRILDLLLTRLEEKADKVSPDRVAHSLALVADNLLLFSGKATSRVETVSAQQRIDELHKTYTALAQKDDLGKTKVH